MNNDKISDSAEKIGVIGSPSSTTGLSIDILGEAVEKKLVGELAYFKYHQEGKENFSLGQIADVELRNVWLEDPAMRSLARHKGQVNPVSGLQDTHLGLMTISAVFEKDGDKFEPGFLGTVPQTGTPIYLAKDQIIDEILQRYKVDLFYLGKVYGSSPKLPLWFKHFGSGLKGAGEAYHLGIFGKTGSGKSVLAKEIVLAYSKFNEMGIFILDPQGEFSTGLRDSNDDITFNNVLGKRTLAMVDRESDVIDVNKITLGRWELFSQLLIEFRFFAEMGNKYLDYQNATAEIVEKYLRDELNADLDKLDKRQKDILGDVLAHIHENIKSVYSISGPGIVNVQKFITEYKNAPNKENNNLHKIWCQVVRFFSTSGNKRTPKQIVERVLNVENGKRPIVCIDLSSKPDDIGPLIWDEKIKPLIIDSFLDELIQTAGQSYKNGKNLNTLVVMDEAHRLAPRGPMENERKDKIRSTLIDAIRTTRKFGLGWMFISQTLSSLDRDIIDQLRINIFGFGLSTGLEFMTLKELVGNDSNVLKLYQSFRDPHSAFDMESRQYSFMSIGPVSPLSFSGTPLFFTSYNKVDDFLNANNIT